MRASLAGCAAVDRGRLGDAPRGRLELLADLWGKYRAASRLLDADPGDAAARQAVKQFAELFMRLAARFGLTPSDRQRMPASPMPTAPVVSSRQRYPKPSDDDLEKRYFGG
jgi:hypothetical protein